VETREADARSRRKSAARTSASDVAKLRPEGSRDPLTLVEWEQLFYARSRDLLGGRKYWRHELTSKSSIHAAIVKGVPYGALVFFVDQVEEIDEEDVEKVLGISARTMRRQRETPDKPMPPDLASKAWLFAETLAKATEIFGSREEAERWMSRPAMGLDGQRPIDLLRTVQGAELVGDFLGRLEYGVYS